MNKAIFNTRKISTQFMVLKMSQKDRKKARRPMQKRPARPRTERDRTETARRPKIAGPEHH